MKAEVYNIKGEITGEATLPKDIFEVPMNSDLVHQVAVSFMANKRQISAHAKTRGEVRGGGKKPWRQKGTGRARHGSIRSPLWKGGGVTFGPRKERIFAKSLPRKMRKKALFMVLSEKARQKNLLILEKLQSDTPKTKEIAKIFKNLPCNNHSCLVVLPGYDKNAFLAARNIKKTGVLEARNLNVLELLNYKYLLMPKESIKSIKETFAK